MNFKFSLGLFRAWSQLSEGLLLEKHDLEKL